MGNCCSTNVKNQVVDQKSLSLPLDPAKPYKLKKESTQLPNLFTLVTQHVHIVEHPPFNVAALSISETAIPVLIAKHTNRSNLNRIEYPVISINSANNFCAAIFSSLSLLELKWLKKFDTSKFIVNIFHYLQGNRHFSRILVISSVAERIAKSLVSLGLTAEVGAVADNLSPYGIVVLTSEVEINEENYDHFRRFSEDGGGICVIYNNCYDNINKFLEKYW